MPLNNKYEIYNFRGAWSWRATGKADPPIDEAGGYYDTAFQATNALLKHFSDAFGNDADAHIAVAMELERNVGRIKRFRRIDDLKHYLASIERALQSEALNETEAAAWLSKGILPYVQFKIEK